MATTRITLLLRPCRSALPARHIHPSLSIEASRAGFATVAPGTYGAPYALPPDLDERPSTQPPQRPPDGTGLTDHEWETRTGRAIYILTQTLPDFFATGLIDGMDLHHRPSLLRTLAPLRPLASATSVLGTDSKRDAVGAQEKEAGGEEEPIYAPNVRLEYTPPVALPGPLPRTLSVEGLPLYIASSVFVRHTLRALYTDLHVELRRVRVNTGASSAAPSSAAAQGRSSGPDDEKLPASRRDKSLFLGMKVLGTARVSGGLGEWDLNCTYTFSPETGLIHRHAVDSIEPAPHESFYEAIRGLRLGLGGTSANTHGRAAACPIPIDDGRSGAKG